MKIYAKRVSSDTSYCLVAASIQHIGAERGLPEGAALPTVKEGVEVVKEDNAFLEEEEQLADGFKVEED